LPVDTPASPPSSPRRVRKRVLVPCLLLALLLVLTAWCWLYGSWADDEPRNPAHSGEGSRCQLLRTADGHIEVRCARVFDRPPEEVWRVVTDYDHFAEIFPHVLSSRAEQEGPDLYAVSGVVATPVGNWTFATRVRHKESADEYLASWDEPGGDLRTARGYWKLTRLDSGRTLLAYAQEIEVRSCPAFLLRALLRVQLPSVVEAVGKRLDQAPASR
jgi:carbon monoxide dehydrogenase subunit G